MSAAPSIREIEWERPPLFEPQPDAEIERWARETGAPKTYPLHFFTHCPWLARSLVRLSTLELAYLDHDLADIVLLVVSRDNSCRYCYAAARILLRVAGMSQAKIESLEGELAMAELEPRRRLALEFVRRLSRCNPPPDPGEIEALRAAGFSREEILELAFVTAQYVAINRITTFVALPPEPLERLGRGWRLLLVRPIVRRLVRAGRARKAPTFLSAEEKSGPFASEVTGRPAASAPRGSSAMHSSFWPERASIGVRRRKCSPTWPHPRSIPSSRRCSPSYGRRCGTSPHRSSGERVSCATS